MRSLAISKAGCQVRDRRNIGTSIARRGMQQPHHELGDRRAWAIFARVVVPHYVISAMVFGICRAKIVGGGGGSRSMKSAPV